MALRIYIRQHSPDCLGRIAGRVKDLRDYRHCQCGWWMYGTSDNGDVYKPQALKVYSYAEADKKRKEANKPKEEQTAGVTVRELADAFLESKRAKRRVEDTIANYKTVTDRLLAFLAEQNPPVLLASRVTPSTVAKLQGQWIASGLHWTTVNAHMTIVRMVFKHGIRMQQLKLDPTAPVEMLEPEKRGRRSDAAEAASGAEDGRTMPLDEEGDTNYRKILASVGQFARGDIQAEGKRTRKWRVPFICDVNRYCLMLEFMYETGLRISDTVHTLVKDFADDGSGWTSYTTVQIKTGDPVTVFFPSELANQMRALRPLWKDYVFLDGSLPWKRFIRHNVWRFLRALGEALGIEDLRAHRFRDSFAVNRLNEGLGIEDVSILLGHRNVQTTRDYYNPWVKSRYDAMRNKRAAAAGVVAINEKRRAG